MKRLLLVTSAFLINVLSAIAQVYPVDMQYHLVKSYAGWKSKSDVHIVKIEHETLSSSEFPNKIEEKYSLYEEGSDKPHEVRTRFDGAMVINPKTTADLWNHYTIGSVLNLIQKKGFQTELRNELEDDAIDFVNRLEADGRTFVDPYLENYIYSLVSKIAPITLVDGRPGNVNIVILNDDIQNAFTFSNGTIVITTGLLASLHTEDELVAILSHEIAHFVLDHSVQNVNEIQKRKKRAEFWAAFATGIAAAADIALATKNQYYRPGNLTLATAAISIGIATAYLEQQGMKYNHEQEDEADEAAGRVLKLLGYNTNALSSALSRIADSYSEERSTNAYFPSYTHRSLIERISNNGTPLKERDVKYEKMVSFAVSSAAVKKYSNRRYRQALALVDQNVLNGVATSDDYILKASCMLALKGDQRSNDDALAAVNKAKSLKDSNINLYKPEVIALLRLGRNGEAQTVLSDYKQKLSAALVELKDVESDNLYDSWYKYFINEQTWATNMLIKLKGM